MRRESALQFYILGILELTTISRSLASLLQLPESVVERLISLASAVPLSQPPLHPLPFLAWYQVVEL